MDTIEDANTTETNNGFELNEKIMEHLNMESNGSFVLDEQRRDQRPVLATYGVLLVIGAVGNLAVLVLLARTRRRRSRVDMLMTHLAIADVCVTCGVIPLEMGWKYTNAWLAGNVCCKVLLVLRAFGLYLSSNVLVCISIDRFFAVLYPLRSSLAWRRSKQMLCVAWTAALACSLPQSYVFRVMRHPRATSFVQCVSFDAFARRPLEVAYNVFCLCAMYLIPLVVISVCYACIFCEIHANSKDLDECCAHAQAPTQATHAPAHGGKPVRVRLRRSGQRMLARARHRTLRMTVTIVSVFALCWLPYAIMAMWYMVDRESAQRVSPRLQDLLFAMAVSNSCMNPLVYGTYTLDLGRVIKRSFKKLCCGTTSASDITGNSGPSSGRNRINNEKLLLTKHRTRPRFTVRFAETTVCERLEAAPARAPPRGPA